MSSLASSDTASNLPKGLLTWVHAVPPGLVGNFVTLKDYVGKTPSVCLCPWLILWYCLEEPSCSLPHPKQVFTTSALFKLPITKVSPARLLDQTEKPLSQPGLESFSPSHSLALHQHQCCLGNKESAPTLQRKGGYRQGVITLSLSHSQTLSTC